MIYICALQTSGHGVLPGNILYFPCFWEKERNFIMICKKCGEQLNDNAKFCPKCGEVTGVNSEPAQATNGMPVPPVMGASAPVGGADSTGFGDKPETPGIMNNKPLLFGIIGGVAVILIVLIIILCSGGGADGVVKDYYKAIQKEDPKKFVSMIPKDIMKDLDEEAGVDKDDVIDCAEEYIDEAYDKDYYDSLEERYEDYKEGDKIKVIILDSVKLDKKSDLYDEIIDGIEDSIDSHEDYIDDMKFKEFDVKKISGVMYIDYKIINDTSYPNRFVAFKYKGDWYSWDVIDDILSAVEYYD